MKFKVVLGLHNFESEDGDSNFGDELDLRIGYQLSDLLRGDLFVASYRGNNGIADADKFWLMLSLKL